MFSYGKLSVDADGVPIRVGRSKGGRMNKAAQKRSSVNLPTDKNGNSVDVGDKVYLEHNGKVRTVTSLMLLMDGSWIVGCDAGGAFMLPESQDNVEVMDE